MVCNKSIVRSSIILMAFFMLSFATGAAHATEYYTFPSYAPYQGEVVSNPYPSFNFQVQPIQNLSANLTYPMNCSLVVYVVDPFSSPSVFPFVANNSQNVSMHISAPLPLGYHSWYAMCSSPGTSGSSSFNQFTVDSVIPPAPITSVLIYSMLPGNGAYTTNTLPAFNWAVYDSASPFVSCALTIDSASYPNLSGSLTSYSVTNFNKTPSSSLSLGNHTWHAVCTDALGNQASSATQTFTVGSNASLVDASPPIVTLFSPINSYPFLDTTFPTFTWAAADSRPNGSSPYSPTLSCVLTVGSTSYPAISVTYGNFAQTVFASRGTHAWNVACTDAAGNNASAQSYQQFSISYLTSGDNEAPNVTLQPIGHTNNTNVTFTWNATDSKAALLGTNLSCTLYIDGHMSVPAIVKSPGVFSATSVFAPFADGTHTFSVTCIDASGNLGYGYSPLGQYGINFFVDTAAPTAFFSGAPAAWTNHSSYIYANCTDVQTYANGSFAYIEECSPWDFWLWARGMNNSNFTPEMLSPPYKTILYASNPGACPSDISQYTGPSDFNATSHSWACAYVKDNAGNGAFSLPTEIKVDTVAPSIGAHATVFAEATSHSGANVAYTMPNATDDVGVASLACLPASGSAFPFGNTTVNCIASDAAGNSASSMFTVAVRDTTPPVITLFGANPMNIDLGGIYTEPGASVTDNYDTSIVAAITGSVNTNAAGAYTRYYNAVDGSGNHAAQKTRMVNVISTALPVITINNPNTSPAQSKTITASTNDGTLAMSVTNGSACSGVLAFVPYSSITFTSELDNGKKVCYRATSTGVAYKMSDAISGIDATGPAIYITGPGSIQGASASISATALGGTVTQMNITTGTACDGTLSFVAYAPMSFYSPSDNGKRICYKAVDGVGNLAYQMSDAITTIISTPSITLIMPAQGSTATSPYPQFTFQVTGTSYPVDCNVLVAVSTSSTNPTSFPVSVNGASPVSMGISALLADGAHSWSVQCGAGVSDTNAFSVLNNDNVAPQVGIFSPTNPLSNSLNPTFTWKAYDSAAASLACNLFVDGVPSGSDAAVTPNVSYSTTSPLAPFSEGNHTIRINCTDASHNSGESTVNSFFDVTAPLASIAGAPASLTTTPANISVICTDANCPSPLSSLSGYPPGPLYDLLLAYLSGHYKTITYASDPGTCPALVSAYTGPAFFTADSHAWVCAYVKDMAGNEGFSVPVEILIGTAPFCGDNVCNNGETTITCPADCPAAPFCGDNICNNGETTMSCIADCPDTIAPVITLYGDNPMNVTLGGTYIEPGASVTDNYYTGLTATVGGTVNTSVDGAYTLTYDAIDGSGNHAIQVARTVNVVGGIACITGADTNGDGMIDSMELNNYMDLWAEGLVSSIDLSNAMDLWAAGAGC